VLERFGGRCFYCGDEATIDEHYIPLVKGGSDTELANHVAACVTCNQDKGTLMPSEFRAKRAAEGRPLPDPFPGLLIVRHAQSVAL
jgi:5-methylcytosine-specific restriction endonuclease McrA